MLIAIDHGNKQIKTVHAKPFTSGLIQSDAPGFGTDYLAYQGKFYALTDQRIPYRRDKTEDERFFILTLFAIAYEIEATEQYSDNLMRVQLAVGLPPAHFGVQAKRFTVYFEGRGAISFQFRGKPYAIFIEGATCFPQSFSAAAATVKNLASISKVLVVDIGGFTADYVCLRNGVPDMAACDSMESGVILLYNRIRTRANAELDTLLEENEIDHILRGEDKDATPKIVALIEQEAQESLCTFSGHAEELVWRQNLDSKLLCLCQLASGVLAADQIICLAAYRTAGVSAQRFNFFVDPITGVGLYFAGHH